MAKIVYLVKGVRTPQVKSGADLKDVAAPFLGHYLIRHLVNEFNIPKVVAKYSSKKVLVSHTTFNNCRDILIFQNNFYIR